jgi:UDPglucose 6-dehydrogenase
MKITVIGLGYLGATHAVAMAQLGHEVIGIEPDDKKREALASGKLPFYEPGLDTALIEVIKQGNITFKARHEQDSAEAELHFICVGTPQKQGSNAADTKYLFAAIEALAPYLNENAVVVGKSTVPVGTAKELTNKLSTLVSFEPKLAWNPEFLREGTALEDSLKPDRIVIGTEDSYSEKQIREVYKPITDNQQTPVLITDIPTAELVKAAANSFLATKISFINAMAEIAEVSGADTVKLAEAIGMDDRIGKLFLRNGIGFGGGCLPKDIRGLMARAEELGVGQAVGFLDEVDQINLRRRKRVVDLAVEELGDVSGRKISMLGATFKPDSDDLRDSPALSIALELAELGAEVYVHDPVAVEYLRQNEKSLHATENLEEALADSELTILGTEWKEYKQLDPAKLSVKNKVVIDGRNVLDRSAWENAGWKMTSLGRG